MADGLMAAWDQYMTMPDVTSRSIPVTPADASDANFTTAALDVPDFDSAPVG